MILYLVVVIAHTIIGNVPKVTSETNMQGWQMPIFILTSCIGTLGVFWISQKIHTCNFLEYLGRNSIDILCPFYIDERLLSFICRFYKFYERISVSIYSNTYVFNDFDHMYLCL